MFAIKAKELNGLQSDALKKRLSELRLELSIEKRKIASTGVSSKVVKTRAIRRDIARILTILNQRGVSL
ncbi:MAG: 50S ribosomal protein L29 [Candidatus Micrarchaeaceae archaeon]